ncbi:MAG TPA: hypothetical protein VKR58_11930 [Aquella sp.]|nr:hypothetical protein [Aquella sp.]
MDYKSISSLVAKYAPVLGEVVGAANPLAGIAVNLIAKVFGANINDEQDIINKITNDPTAAIKLRQLELENQEHLVQASVSDRMSARDREEEIVKATGKRDYVLDVIAIMVVLGYFMVCFTVLFMHINNSSPHEILYMLIGQLTGAFLMVLGYYFGGSLPTFKSKV